MKFVVVPAAACWIAIALWTMSVSAAPITFTTTQFLASTAASTSTLADADNATNPPTALPLIIDSTVFDANNFASGSAIAGPGLLSTSADVTSTSGFANAVGSAEFIGTFKPILPFVNLNFGLSNSNFTSGATAISDGSLLIRLLSGGTTLYDSGIISVGGAFFTSIPLPVGVSSTLDVLLFSEGSVVSGGSASNTATATFSAAAVPEPATLALLAIGVAGLAALRRRQLN